MESLFMVKDTEPEVDSINENSSPKMKGKQGQKTRV